MNSVLKSALVILAVSISATVWGVNYRQNHAMEGAVGMIFGGASKTYELAGWAFGLGVLGLLIGIGVLIAGLVKSGGSGSPK